MTESNPFTSTTAQQHVSAERHLLELCGSENQRERYYAGLLPEAELLSLAREILFAPFAGMRRWSKIHPDAVRHRDHCGNRQVDFITHTPTSVTAEEWSMLKMIQDIANAYNSTPDRIGHLYINVIEHAGACLNCRATVSGRAASVRAEWAGRELSREYSLVQR